ncbi:MAG: 4-hydroxy-tetrahydrodipicolinate synthase [Bacteroidia bacterium]|nr:4-hydroxy-tetrahydrodipicolinate synthase [Chitinophagaceae bacterium]MCZ2139913.1 4-hydroxy-tetrahydrodipicolinate synthase [Bacteroidia bacterium]
MKGTGVALVTPFNEDFSIDFNALEKIIEHCIHGGLDYLVALGTTGEAPTLSADEKKSVYKFIADKTNGRVKLVAGIGGNNTQEIVQTIKSFDFTGYDAILSVSPYYNKPNQEGIYRHYITLAAASPKPIILYNVPGRTGSCIAAATTLKLANESPKFIAVKEASGNAELFMDILHEKPNNFSVISGDDNLTIPFMALGFSGVISVIAQAFPKAYSTMVNHALAGNFNDAKEIHFKLYNLMKTIFADGSPGGIKVVLNQLELCKNIVRLPLAPVNKTVENRLIELTKAFQ